MSGSSPPECSIPGCANLASERGWCHKHYIRWYRHGDPLANHRRQVSGTARRMNGGYVQIYLPTHPLAFANGWVDEHRMMAWDAGLLTDPKDHVHHKNERRDDNRLENFEVLSPAAHNAHHNPPVLLTEDELREALALRASGQSLQSIANTIGVSRYRLSREMKGTQT